VPVTALGEWSEPVRFSRHCDSFAGFSDNLSERWLEWLAGSAPEGAIVLPCSDAGLELVARNRALLEARGLRAVEADDEVLLAMLDKRATYELAERAGVPIPLAATVRDEGDAAPVLDRLAYPCALKPLHPMEFRRLFGLKGFVAQTRDDLLRALERTAAAGIEMQLTEMIPGPDHFQSSYSYIAPDGEPLFSLSKQKLRQWPIRFGSGCFHLTDRDPEVIGLGLRFFAGVGLRGLGNVEFKRDPRDGALKLIECNHRFTEATGLLVAAGMDIPLFTYRRLAGLPEPPMDRYREGLGLWYPVNDFRAFRAYRREGELSFAGWARSLMRPLRFPLADAGDPLPAIAQSRVKLRNGLRKVRRTAGQLGRPATDAGN
jgi:predicted ATP-grasp superfamily ATP-dependent carboligase